MIRKNGINVVSLCDGMSCGQIALHELGIEVNTYYASEIDPNAIKVTQENFNDTIQLGDVNNITHDTLLGLPKIDLIMFGFPCRSLTKTTAGRTEYNNGLDGISGLFFKCNEILQWIKRYNNSEVLFLVENVETDKVDDMKIISEMLGVEPVLIDSNLFSAQDRKRYYWTNIPLNDLPESNPLILNDILDTSVDEKFFYNIDFDYYGEDKKICGRVNLKGHDIIKRVNSRYFKSPTLVACRGGSHQKKVYIDGRARKLTPNEYRKLQTIPEWYKMNVANTHIYNMCGDGWTIEVIKFILSNIKNIL